MRVLMLSYEFPPVGGGGAGVVYGLSMELARRGHEVDVVTMGYRGSPRRERIGGVEVRRVPCVRLNETHCTMPEQATFLSTALPYVLGLARKGRYDLNHTHFIVPDGLLALALKRIKGLAYVVTCHGSDVPGYNPQRFLRAHRAIAPAWRGIVNGAERIVCPSNGLRDLLLQAEPRAHTTVIPNGIARDRLRPDVPKRNRILVVSRMVERKGIQYFLRALKGLELRHEVIVAGDGPYLGTLRALAGELGVDVDFRGWLDRESAEFTELYETSQIYVFPSEIENFPIVLLEAMSAGAAIITTKGTGCAEVVGDAALLVEPCDPEAIRMALCRLASDPDLCRELGAAARTRLEENFTWPAVANRYLDCYAECLRTA